MANPSHQIASPIQSMPSQLLASLTAELIAGYTDKEQKKIEICAWLKIKNAALLPSMLVIEFKRRSSINLKHWKIIDTARISEQSSLILLTGSLGISPKNLTELNIYFCHPSDNIRLEVEELRVNSQLVRKASHEQYYVA
jgi:hypothetical protein